MSELDSWYAIGCHPCTSLNCERCVEDNSPERQHDPPSHRLQIIVLVEAIAAIECIHRAERCVILMPTPDLDGPWIMTKFRLH